MNKKKKFIRSETVMGVIIAFIMISGMFGIYMSQGSGTTKLRYNNHVFEYSEGRFSTEINKERIYFFNEPEQFNADNIPKGFIEIMQNTSVIYYTFDSNHYLANDMFALGSDLSSNVFSTNNLYIEIGTIEGFEDFKKITCQNATEEIPVIYIKSSEDSESNEIFFEENCLIANVNINSDITRLRDGILYKYYNIK